MAITPETMASARQTSASVPLQGRRTQPVKVWATVGAALVLLVIYMISKWLILGHARPAPVGDTSTVSALTFFMIRANEVLMCLLSGFALWRFLIKPWRREGHITFDGLFVLAWGMLWSMDPWSNAARTWWNYSSLFYNLGCFQCEVPFWQVPLGENYSEPIFFIGAQYFGWLPLWCFVQAWLMRKSKTRWPQMGMTGLIGIAFLAGMAYDILCELLWLRWGLYTYDGSIQSISLWGGHYYQFPWYESLMMGGFWTGGAMLLYFKNDKGQTWAERGIDEVRITGIRRTGLRYLATVGFMATVFVVTYEVPAYVMSHFRDERPADAYAGHLTNMMCGPGTEYACPGPKIPAVTRESAYITPQGELRWPKQ